MNSGLAARLMLVVVLSGLAAGCSLAAGIFKAGFWVGIVLALVLVVGVMLMFRGRR
jgi:positive regulator of sigma E activity